MTPTFSCLAFASVYMAGRLLASPLSLSENNTSLGFNSVTRDAFPPQVPDRPPGIPSTSFHTSQFEFFEQIGFVPGSPGVEAAPVFLFSRTMSNNDPCYPESAIVLGSNPPRPNPGTDKDAGTFSANPGADCTNPGPYHGAYSPGNPFPVYVGAVNCGDTWRVNYDLYYVHDGVMLEGHRHDWEGATVVFKRDQLDQDWWHRDSVIDNEHSFHESHDWSEIITVDVDLPGGTDVSDETIGKNKKHPKVFVGFFSHAAFSNKDTSRKTATPPSSKFIADDEYRSNDWWRLPRPGDLHLWTEIPASWHYGEASSTPAENHNTICGW